MSNEARPPQTKIAIYVKGDKRKLWYIDAHGERHEMVPKSEVDRANEILFDMFNQSCTNESDYGKYDHMCLSAYEHAQDYLIEIGMITKEQCQRN